MVEVFAVLVVEEEIEVVGWWGERGGGYGDAVGWEWRMAR